MSTEIEHLMQQAVEDGVIVCGGCGKILEPDAEKCGCGWLNPLRDLGFI